MELATVFIERKDVLFFLQQTSQKTKKKMVDFTEHNMEEPDNFKTSGLSDHYKRRRCKLLMRVNTSKVHNMERMVIQLCNEPVVNH